MRAAVKRCSKRRRIAARDRPASFGTAAMAHLVVACRNMCVEEFPGDMLGPEYHEVRIVKQPMDIQGPLVTITSRPGLGVDVDWDVVRAHRLN